LTLAKENIGKTFQNIGTSNDFLNRTSIAQEIKARIDIWDYINQTVLAQQRQQSTD
jgi:hypothetical protein